MNHPNSPGRETPEHLERETAFARWLEGVGDKLFRKLPNKYSLDYGIYVPKRFRFNGEIVSEEPGDFYAWAELKNPEKRSFFDFDSYMLDYYKYNQLRMYSQASGHPACLFVGFVFAEDGSQPGERMVCRWEIDQFKQYEIRFGGRTDRIDKRTGLPDPNDTGPMIDIPRADFKGIDEEGNPYEI